jgi:hypothetical protein
MSLPSPFDEAARLAALHRYSVLDSSPEEAFDDLTNLASLICATPIALVSLVDSGRIWFKSRFGLNVSEIPRIDGFCSSNSGAESQVLCRCTANYSLRPSGRLAVCDRYRRAGH